MDIYDLLEREEGFRSKPYLCSENYPTIGIGTKIGPKGASVDNYTFSITRDIAKLMMKTEVEEIKRKLFDCHFFAECEGYDRKAVLVSMSYQMGVGGLLKFKRMIAAIEREDWQAAADEALNSKWARQTPQRAMRHAEVLLCGNLEQVYGDIE